MYYKGAVNYSVTPPVPPLVITTTSLPDATDGVFYSEAVVAVGGVLPYEWNLAAGALPPGLTLSSGTGVISGTPSGGAGGHAFSPRVTDNALTVVSKALGITVLAAPLPGPQLAGPYSSGIYVAGPPATGNEYFAVIDSRFSAGAPGVTTALALSTYIGLFPGFALSTPLIVPNFPGVGALRIALGNQTLFGPIAATYALPPDTFIMTPFGSLLISAPLVMPAGTIPGTFTGSVYHLATDNKLYFEQAYIDDLPVGGAPVPFGTAVLGPPA